MVSADYKTTVLAALILPKSAAAGIITAQLLYVNIIKYIQFKVHFNIKFAEIMSKIAKSMPMQISVSSPSNIKHCDHSFSNLLLCLSVFACLNSIQNSRPLLSPYVSQTPKSEVWRLWRHQWLRLSRTNPSATSPPTTTCSNIICSTPPVQQPPIQPPAQQTSVQQPPPSDHEDEQQVDNPQQAANQDDEISYLRSPAVKGKEFHLFQPNPSVQVTASLAEAIMLMTEELHRHNPLSLSSKWAKTKEPDTFDSSDPKKLNNFILLCNFYFTQNSAYSNDAEKISFALSHLRGIALEYFEPSIIDSDNYPTWMDNWSAFIITLHTQFGPIDPAGDAENSIDHLKMQDNQHIVKYNIEFNCLAIHTGWDENVLHHRYYTSLAEWIEDIIRYFGTL